MAELKTDFKDDILDTTQNQLRKYRMINNDDGTISFVDVTEYLQMGDSFGAQEINANNAFVNLLALNKLDVSRIAIVTGALPDTEFANVNWLNYPAGFTRDNCVIIGFMHLERTGAIWKNDTTHCRAELRSSHVTIYSDGDESVRTNSCKVVLYKYL